MALNVVLKTLAASMFWIVMSAALANSATKTLETVEALRLNDHRQALHLLNSLDVSTLSRDQREHYDYLQLYLATFEGGNLQAIFQGYGDLLSHVTSETVRIKTLASQVSLAGYLGEWQAGFQMARQLDTLLTPSIDDTLRRRALSAMVTFYSKAEQPKLAHALIDRWRPLTRDAPASVCKLGIQELVLLFEHEFAALSLNKIQDVKSQCEQAKHDFYVLFADSYLFYYLVKNNHLDQAEVLLKPLSAKVKALDFPHLETSFYAHVSELYQLRGRVEEAQALALDVLAMDEQGEYLPAKIHALEILLTLAQHENNFAQAYDYLEALAAVRSRFRETSVVKHAAFEKANHELILAQNKLKLLDKRNRLLETQSQLAKQHVVSTVMALIFISSVLAGAAVWLYRNRKTQQALQQQVTTDTLTGVFNRGYFVTQAEVKLARAEAKTSPCCFILLDLDHFKRINVIYGNKTGDWVLIQVPEALVNVLGNACLIGRLGGEEFGVLVEQAELDHGLTLAEQCRVTIKAIDTTPSGHSFSVSASFGVSDTTQLGYRVKNLLSAADLALYNSKQYGRNRVYKYDSNVGGQ